MKKFIIIPLLTILSLVITSCTSAKALEGNWETVSLIKEGQQLPVLESNIKFFISDKEIKAKGCAGVNLYNSNIIIKGSAFAASHMENTGFLGLADEMEYEDLFFTVLMNADSYKIENEILYLYASQKNMEIQLKRK